MFPRILGLSFLFALTACDDRTITVKPEPARAVLANGSYIVEVTGIRAIECDGVVARELVGQRIAAELRGDPAHAVFDLEGLPLEGVQRDGVLHALYAEDIGYDDAPAEAEEYDVDVDTGAVDGEEEDCVERSDGEEEDCGGGGGAPDHPDAPPRGATHRVRVDAEADAADHAFGHLAVQSGPACRIDVEIDVMRGHMDAPQTDDDEPADDDDVDAGDTGGGPR